MTRMGRSLHISSIWNYSGFSGFGEMGLWENGAIPISFKKLSKLGLREQISIVLDSIQVQLKIYYKATIPKLLFYIL
jgi:hypothetical protein